tara:strand:+ start:583 stop:735 length:153 start_codon:yes stop_codon:yes gene_type:complete
MFRHRYPPSAIEKATACPDVTAVLAGYVINTIFEPDPKLTKAFELELAKI